MADFIADEIEWTQNQYSLSSLKEANDIKLPAIIKVTGGCFGLTDLETFSSDDILVLYGWQMEERILIKSNTKPIVSMPIDSVHRFQINKSGNPVLSLTKVLETYPPPVTATIVDHKGDECMIDVSNEYINLGFISLNSSHYLEYILASTTVKGTVWTENLVWLPIYRKIRFEVATKVNGVPTELLEEHMKGYLYITRFLKRDAKLAISHIIEHKLGAVYYSELLDVLEEYDYIRALPMGTWQRTTKWTPLSNCCLLSSSSLPVSTNFYETIEELESASYETSLPVIRDQQLPSLTQRSGSIKEERPSMNDIKATTTPNQLSIQLVEELVKYQKTHVSPVRRSSNTYTPLTPETSNKCTEFVSKTLPKDGIHSAWVPNRFDYSNQNSLASSQPSTPPPKLPSRDGIPTSFRGSTQKLSMDSGPKVANRIQPRKPPPPIPKLDMPPTLRRGQTHSLFDSTKQHPVPIAMLKPFSNGPCGRDGIDDGTKNLSKPATGDILTISDIPKDITQLSVIQVCQCLTLLNMNEYMPRFKEMQIDGMLLHACSVDELVAEFGFGILRAKKLELFSNHGWRPSD